MNVEEIAQELTRLSMPEDEARVWTYLRVLGPSKAAEIAEVADLSRARTYRALDSLAKDGFVRTGVGRPRTHESIEPDVLFDHLRRRAQRDLEEADEAGRILAAAIQDLERTQTPRMTQPRFDVIRSRTNTLDHLKSLVDAAGLSVDIYYPHPAAPRLMTASNLWGALDECAKGGVGVRLILAPDNGDVASLAAHDRLEIRTAETETRGIRAIVDGQTAVVALVESATSRLQCDECAAFATDASDFIRAEQHFFDLRWASADALGDAGATGRSAAA